MRKGFRHILTKNFLIILLKVIFRLLISPVTRPILDEMYCSCGKLDGRSECVIFLLELLTILDNTAMNKLF